MKKSLLLMASLFAAATMSAQTAGQSLKVMRNDGTMVDAPVFGSPEASLIKPLRCGNLNEEPAATRAIGTASVPYTPHTGSPRIIVVLAQFADKAFSMHNTRAAFEQFSNGQSAPVNLGNGNDLSQGSMAQYFATSSSGQFTPTFDVFGPVTLPNKVAYYGGQKDDGSDENAGQMVLDAMKLLNDSISDASKYDSDNDGYIDGIMVIYAGLGQNYGGDSTTVWAKSSAVVSTFKNKKTGRYAVTAEHMPYTVAEGSSDFVISGVGVAVHEFSHCLGLPDIYPTSASAQQVNNQEMEYWDLMDGGEYVYNTLCPTPYIAWEKQQMGWPVDVQTLTTSGSYTMATSNEQGGTVYKIVNDDDPTQYFLLENIIKTGWNSHLPSPGLMVYRVIYNGEAIQADYRFNNIAGKPRLAIVPADGVCLSSYIDANANYYRESLRHDLFPGNPAVTALNDDMALPNFAFYTNYTAGTTKKVNKALSNIAQSAEGVITFDFVANNTAGIDGIIDNTTATHQPIYTLDGRYVGTSTTALPRGVYVRGGKKFVK